ncbi:type II toxin-antitoxin system RelE/ParE family toxin [Bifidobacterium sp. ESL0690]|uniref:type II toxin-antitoxin system RelE/ParE family toxin n=1 Tax=Bifidobacterium sp. ESL0690 TaxID=2983214 RepID=UPI0023F9EEEE|nr:type II toxin-antitoxin system RelE/ParE family toxin [Bifidobacterium sp. ESL0690]WEV46732.1 type II toxin-antitoxin system RelE/ParE family toxin [Bifidobacterium sp. ESL0690]
MNVITTDTFDTWLDKLPNQRAKDKIYFWIQRIQYNGAITGDTKSVKDGVNECRFHTGAGYRVYYAKQGSEIILLLAGGDKSTQRRDIEKAKAMQKEWSRKTQHRK